MQHPLHETQNSTHVCFQGLSRPWKSGKKIQGLSRTRKSPATQLVDLSRLNATSVAWNPKLYSIDLSLVKTWMANFSTQIITVEEYLIYWRLCVILISKTMSMVSVQQLYRLQWHQCSSPPDGVTSARHIADPLLRPYHLGPMHSTQIWQEDNRVVGKAQYRTSFCRRDCEQALQTPTQPRLSDHPKP